MAGLGDRLASVIFGFLLGGIVLDTVTDLVGFLATIIGVTTLLFRSFEQARTRDMRDLGFETYRDARIEDATLLGLRVGIVLAGFILGVDLFVG